MSKPDSWTLLGGVLKALDGFDLSDADKITVRNEVDELIRVYGTTSKKRIPDFQEVELVLRQLKIKGFDIPEEYFEEKANFSGLIKDLDRRSLKRDSNALRITRTREGD